MVSQTKKFAIDHLTNALSLWPHQNRALFVINEYINKYRQNKTAGSCLIHMPTGSGKSGIVAVSSRLLHSISNVLVLTPRVALRNQLALDINTRFFERLSRRPKTIPKIVHNINYRWPDPLGNDNQVWVATIQKILGISRTNTKVFNELLKKVNLIVVDEGHYEPALAWSDVIRRFKIPKVILTATPYRNDLKLFDIDLKHTYGYSYMQAEADHYIRQVKFYEYDSGQSARKIIKQIIKYMNDTFGKNSSKVRVMIRCEYASTIMDIGTELVKQNITCIAIHERFKESDNISWALKNVPNPEKHDAQFWIHQFKLLEGIDDSRFQILALIEPLRNARALVQQVGRVIRNPKRSAKSKAIVFDYTNKHQKELWDGFLAYDKNLYDKGLEGIALATGKGLVEQFLKIQPWSAYFEGTFRKPFNFNDVDIHSDLRLPLEVNLIQTTDNFNLKRVYEYYSKQLSENDTKYQYYDMDKYTRVFLYISYRSSPLLKWSCFVECKLGVTVIHLINDLLAIYDSHGWLPVNNDDLSIKSFVSPNKLKKLLLGRGAGKLTQISLQNSNLGITAIRSRSFSAESIEYTAPSLDDHAQLCTQVRGYTEIGKSSEIVRRYIGFSRGRISQTGSGQVNLGDYLKWINELDYALNARWQSNKTFSRYAKTMHTPQNPMPQNILLDIAEAGDIFETAGILGVGSGKNIDIRETCVAVLNRQIKIKANISDCICDIRFDNIKKRYQIESDQLRKLFKPKGNLRRGDFITWLNQHQAFRIVPTSENSIYSAGQFYRPIYKTGRHYSESEFLVGQMMITDAILDQIGSEKGKQIKKNKWENDSLFGFIDSLGSGSGLKGLFGNPDILICDDMGTELADFIMVDENPPRLIAIHAKANSTRRLFSASAISDICSQATKNIDFISMFGVIPTSRSSRWKGQWKANLVKGVIKTRIRKGPTNIRTLLNKMNSIRRNPFTGREIWLVLGRTLSKSSLIAEMKKNKPNAAALQATYLLHSTMASAQAVGAKLRVICSP